MDVRKFFLSYYNNAIEDFHIHSVRDGHLAGKPHSHDYFQIYFVKKGRLEHIVDGDCAVMTRGDMFIIPPDRVHYVRVDENTEFYSLSFMPDFICGASESAHLVTSFLQSLMGSEAPVLRAVSLHSDDILYIESILSKIQREFEQKPLGYREGIFAMTMLPLLLLARRFYDSKQIKKHFGDGRQIVRHSVEYIEENYFEDITIAEISKHFAMSKSSFCKLFLSEVGYTFNFYLNKTRIEKACEYIKKGQKLTVISGLVGYGEFSTFYRNFKKITGMSPAEYKGRLFDEEKII